MNGAGYAFGLAFTGSRDLSQSHFWRTPSLKLIHRRAYWPYAQMSFRIHKNTCAAALAAALALYVFAGLAPALAQSDDVDPEVRIQQLENQLRQLTGQNEELQYRNRQLEERLRMLQGGTQGAQGQGSPQGAAPGQPGAPMTNTAAMPPVQQAPSYPQQPPAYQTPPGGYPPQVTAPVPIAQDPAGPRGGRRGDAFDPTQNPNAPGAPRALGGGQLPMPADGQIGAPGGRGAGDPLNLANTGGAPAGAPPRNANGTGALTTLPPSATPRDEFDLGVGYIQRKDYALAEETMRNFQRKYPGDPMMAESQFWLGESFFQRQQ